MTSTSILNRVERACAQLHHDRHPVTFTAVAARTGLGRTTLYRDPTLRAVIEEHRRRTTKAAPLSASPTRSPPSGPRSTPSPPEYAITRSNSDASPPEKAESVNRSTPEHQAH